MDSLVREALARAEMEKKPVEGLEEEILQVLEELDVKFRFVEAIYGKFEIGISHIKSVFQRSNSQLKILLNLLIRFEVLEKAPINGYMRFRRGKHFFQILQATRYLVKIVEGEDLNVYEASILAEALENDTVSNLLSYFFEKPEILTKTNLKKPLINVILRGENQLVRIILKPVRRAKIRLHTTKSKPTIQISLHHQLSYLSLPLISLN